MRSDYSTLDRDRADDSVRTRGGMAGKTGIYIGIGAVALVVAAAGAYYVGTLKSAPAAAPQAANRPAPAAQPAAAPAQPAQPQIQWKTVGNFGSWEARCTTPPGQTKQLCTAVLQVVDNKSKNVLMAWIVGPDDKGAMQSVLQTPTGLMVSSGVEMKLGNAPVHKIGFQSCGTQQCTAVTAMNDAFIKEVTTAPKADVTLTAQNGRTLNFGIPVAGFDKALAAIKKGG